MNTKKHKNKNKPKPVNLNPLQNNENIEKAEEKVETESASVIEERVPEIISEVLPSIHEKTSESETPKKPKRNKGKKKKSEKYDSDDKKEETQMIVEKPVEVKEECSKVTKETKAEENNQEMPETYEAPKENVTPTNRKKKKNKKTVEQNDGEQSAEKLEISEPQSAECKNTETIENESKTPKKKNKKKKRSDSERSEETLAVTVAFQKLLEAQDDKKEKKEAQLVDQKTKFPSEISPDKTKTIEMGKAIKTALQTDCSEIQPKTPEPCKDKCTKSIKKNKKDKKHYQIEIGEILQKPDVESQEKTKELEVPAVAEVDAQEISARKTEQCSEQYETEEKTPCHDIICDLQVLIPEPTKDSSKIKRSNKKDKKQPENKEIKDQQQVLSEAFPKAIPSEVMQISATAVKVRGFEEKEQENVTKDTIAVEMSAVECDKSSKSKAKIAKPVKKKGKETPDIQDEEDGNVSNTTPEKLMETISKTEQSSLDSETKTSEEIKDLESKLLEIKPTIFDEPTVPNQDTSVISEQMQEIDIPEQEKEKRRKKSPNTKGTEKYNKHPEQTTILSKDAECPSKIETESEIEKSVLIPPTEKVELSEVSQTADVKSELPKMLLLEETPPVATPSSVNTNPSAESSQLQEKNTDMHIPETKSNKKRKKSPKPQKNTPQEKDIEDYQHRDMTKDDEPIVLEANSATASPSLMQEIEIRSVKTEESEGSICDLTPDIQYPRCSSETDNNNNTSIREVTSDSTKLDIPVSSPLIQGSGETPLPTPEISFPGVVISEIQSNSKQKEEKTDLKSKVMEVNKDMEDLRKSIERSLAELTAIEKGEETLEKQFEDVRKSETQEVKVEQEPQASKEQKKTGVEKLSEIITEHSLNVIKAEAKEIIEKEIKSEEQQKTSEPKVQLVVEPQKADTANIESQPPQIQPPPRRENKGKGKNKKKGKQDFEHTASTSTASSTTETSTAQVTTTDSKDAKDNKKEDKTESKTDNSHEKGKQQTDATDKDKKIDDVRAGFEPIETFEDAMTSSTDADDVNNTFEIIAKEANSSNASAQKQENPEINVSALIEDDEKKDGQEKRNAVSPSKNLLGHPDIPVRLNRPDYKKEKNKTPNSKQARVNIKDDVPIDVNKHSKESQTENRNRFLKDRKSTSETITCMTAENEDFVYKYSFRKVFLPNACHVCKKDLKQSRVPCSFCNLVFYCCPKHKDEDYQQHQGFCFAVSTIGHLKDQKYIYADTQGVTGHDYRLLRMQMIVSCEKVMKRKLHPWEQEALLYPRLCADVNCREWRQGKLKDCEGCGQISYCANAPDHLPSSHQHWCKSYLLYHKLVCYQQTKGRLEPKLPTKVMKEVYQMPEKLNEVLASLYEEKIDMNDIEYAALTQIATAPLTAAYCQQLYSKKMNASYANGAYKKSSFTIHVVGAELQFEADALNKWELFFLHLRPDLSELRVVLIGQELNPSNLPLDLLGKIKLCDNCRQNKRRVIFDFQDQKSYLDYWATDFILPDLVCAFNPSIERSSIYNGKDTWPATIKCITKLKVPFVITSYTLKELTKDLEKIKSCSEINVNVISDPKYNAFASVRPDRNFISDDEIPLLFKNYCFAIVCGVL